MQLHQCITILSVKIDHYTCSWFKLTSGLEIAIEIKIEIEIEIEIEIRIYMFVFLLDFISKQRSCLQISVLI